MDAEVLTADLNSAALKQAKHELKLCAAAVERIAYSVAGLVSSGNVETLMLLSRDIDVACDRMRTRSI